jgi:high-affinity iron transporter
MITGLLIGLREGVEAALVVGILVACLARTGNASHLPKLWTGVAAAVVGSGAVGALLFLTVGGLAAPYEQLFEGSLMLLAAGFVTWMLFWMRTQAHSIRHDLEDQVARTLRDGGAWSLVLLAFVSVAREGIETALFLYGQVAAADAAAGESPASVLLGAAAGLGLAVVVGIGVYRGSRRLNVGAFFTWTGVALVLVAAGLMSRAVHELVEAGLVTFGTQTAFDLGGVLSDREGPGQFLHAALGYSAAPELTTLIVYVAYLVPVLALYLRPTALPRVPPGPRRGPAAI